MNKLSAKTKAKKSLTHMVTLNIEPKLISASLRHSYIADPSIASSRLHRRLVWTKTDCLIISINYHICRMWYLRNRKHFPCFYRVIETRGKVCEKREIAWKHGHEVVRVFPRNFKFLANIPKCFYKLYRNKENVFYFLYKIAF